jgi:hypothetical protein
LPKKGVAIDHGGDTMRLLLLVSFAVFTGLARGDEPLSPDGTPLRAQGGLIIARKNNQTAISLGGAFLPRRVRVVTRTPEGPVVSRFSLPSTFQGPGVAPLPQCVPAMLRLEMPDPYGVLCIEGQLIDTLGAVRFLQSPPLAPGMTYNLHVRVAFKVGERLLVEDREIPIHSGERLAVRFDGSRAAAFSPSE